MKIALFFFASIFISHSPAMEIDTMEIDEDEFVVAVQSHKVHFVNAWIAQGKNPNALFLGPSAEGSKLVNQSPLDYMLEQENTAYAPTDRRAALATFEALVKGGATMHSTFDGNSLLKRAFLYGLPDYGRILLQSPRTSLKEIKQLIPLSIMQYRHLLKDTFKELNIYKLRKSAIAATTQSLLFYHTQLEHLKNIRFIGAFLPDEDLKVLENHREFHCMLIRYYNVRAILACAKKPYWLPPRPLDIIAAHAIDLE